MMHSYDRRVALGLLTFDPHQRSIIGKFSLLEEQLSQYQQDMVATENSFWASIRCLASPPVAPTGLYLYGTVGTYYLSSRFSFVNFLFLRLGCGKTFLMDLFFKSCTFKAKKRMHFHEFMQHVHTRLYFLKREIPSSSLHDQGISAFVTELLQDCRLLCLDECQVTNISDAMILARLFKELYRKNQFTLVTTSNRHPTELYLNGIKRASFIPCIDLLQEKNIVFSLDSPIDYRKRGTIRMAKEATFLCPLTDENANKINSLFFEHVQIEGFPIQPVTLTVYGRPWIIKEACGSLAKLSFHEVCEESRNADDFLQLASHFRTIYLTDIPVFNLEKRNEMRRFIHFIDALYDQRVKLFCTADQTIHKLLQFGGDFDPLQGTPITGTVIEAADIGGPIIAQSTSLMTGAEEVFAFQRLKSRLIEMHSDVWS